MKSERRIQPPNPIKTFLKYVFTVSLTIFLTFLFLIILFHIPRFQKILVDQFIKHINLKSSCQISIDYFHFSLSGEFEVRNFKLFNIDYGESKKSPCIYIKSIYCLFNPLSLSSHQLKIKYLDIRAPVFKLHIDKNHQSNIKCVKEKKKKKRNAKEIIEQIFNLILIQKLNISDGIFQFRYDPNSLFIDVPEIDIVSYHSAHSQEMISDLHGNNIKVILGEKINLATNIRISANVWSDGVHNSDIHISLADTESYIDGNCQLSNFTDPHLIFEAVSQINSEYLVKMFNLKTDLNGNLYIKSYGEGPAKDLQIKNFFICDKFLTQGYEINGLYSEAIYNKRVVDLKTITGSIYNGKLTGSGKIYFKSDRKGLDISGVIHDFDILRYLKAQHYPISINGLGDISFNIKSRSFSSDLIKVNGVATLIEQTNGNSFRPFTLTSDYVFQERTLIFKDLSLFNKTSFIHTEKFSLSKSGIQGFFSFTTDNIGKLTNRAKNYFKNSDSIPDITGQATGTISISGKPKDLSIQFSISSGDFKYKEHFKSELRLQGTFKYPSYTIDLDKIKMNGKDGQLSGQLSLLKMGGNYHIKKLSLHPHLFNISLAEDILNKNYNIRGSVSGDLLFNPSKEHLKKSKIKMERIRYGNIPLGKGTCSFHFLPEAISDLDLELHQDKGQIKISGDFPFNGHSSWTVKGENYNLSRLQRVQPFPINGLVSFYLQSSNTSDDKISLYIVCPEMDIGGFNSGLAILEGYVSFDEKPVIMWNASFFDAHVLSQGEIIIDQNDPLSCHFQLLDTPLVPILNLFSLERFSNYISGNVSGNIDLKMDIRNPESMNAEIRLDQMSLNTFGFGSHLTQQSSIQVSGSSIHIEKSSFESEEMSFTIGGNLNLKGSMCLDIKGKSRLNNLDQLVNIISSPKGDLTFDLNLSGSISDPDFSGAVAINELYFYMPLFNLWFEDCAGEIVFSRKIAKIESFEGIAGGSYFQIDGDLGLKNYLLELLDISFSSEKIEFTYPSGFKTIADISLNVSGNPVSPLIHGQINIQKSQYSERINYKTMIVNESRAKLSLRQRPPIYNYSQNYYFNPRFQLSITAPNNVRIDNNFAHIISKLDLQVNGTLEKPIILGHIEALTGDIIFQGKTFKINRATLDLVDTEQFNPIINLLASSEIQGYKIFIEISGPIYSDLTIRPYSTPELNSLDLWSLLIIGKTRDQLTDNSQDYLASGVAYLTGSIQDQIEKRFKYWMGFDEFSIDPILSTSDESPSARFTVKKQFGPNLTVTYSRTAGSYGDLLIIEYRLSENLYLVGKKDEDGTIGGDLRFRWEIR